MNTGKKLLLLFSFYLIILFFFEIYTIGGREDRLVKLTFTMIIFQSLYFLVFYEGILYKFYFTFSFFFFGFIPYLEYIKNITYWGFPPLEIDTYLLINIILFIVNMVFYIFYVYIKNIYSRMKFHESRRNFKDNFLSLLFVSMSVFIITFYLSGFSLVNLFIRGGGEDNIVLDRSLSLIFRTTIKSIPAVIFYFYVSYFPEKKIKIFLLFFILLLTIFPTSVPRFHAAAIYIPVLLFLFAFLRKGATLSYSIILGLLFIFPFLDQFRHYKKGDALSLIPNFNFLLSGHFDSYQSIGQVIQHNFITTGHQLLGNLLFFIPRSIWPDKPKGTGTTLAELDNLPFTNVSANYYAEGYANFGLFGILLFCLVLSYVCGRYDGKYIALKNNNRKQFLPFYYFLVGYIIFLLRGDLLSSLSYLVGFFVAFLFVGKINTLKIKYGQH